LSICPKEPETKETWTKEAEKIRYLDVGIAASYLLFGLVKIKGSRAEASSSGTRTRGLFVSRLCFANMTFRIANC
jgi:hypothetical protein